MIRLGALFTIALLAALPNTLRAQNGAADGGAFGPLEALGSAIPDRADRPLRPALDANPRFPLTAKIVRGHFRYNGNHEYQGTGVILLAGQSFDYRFRCSNAFVTNARDFEARWVQPDKKLEILMQRRKSTHTDTCRLSTSLAATP